MPMNVTIITANTEHAGLIADLSRQTFHDSFAGTNAKADMEKFLDKQFTRQALMEEVGAKGNIFLLAYNGQEGLVMPA
jgi:hypothetical protein